MASSGGWSGLIARCGYRVRPMGIAGICLALLLSACTPSSAGPTPAKPVSTTDTSRLVMGHVTLAAHNFRPWLVTREEMVLAEVSDTLTRVNVKTGALESGLAESWSLSPDLKTWTFKLRPNIPFHDGYGTMTADDVKFTWEQYIQKDSVQSRAPIYRLAIDGDIKNFQIVGPLEFKLSTTKPVVYLAFALSNAIPGLPIQSKKYWETKPAEAAVHPLGTGPFKFVSSTPGVEVQLEAVANHWRQTSTFKAVTIRIIADDAARLAAVASGAVDFAPITPKLVAEAKAQGVRILSIKDTAAWVVYPGGMYPGHDKYTPNAPWIQADNPAKGLAIREALSYAIDRKTILEKVFYGDGSLHHSPMFEVPSNPQLVDPSWPLPVYDVAKAKQKLAEGGYPNGFEVTVPIYEQKAGTTDLSEAVAGSFEAIGLKVKRLVADYNGVIKPAIQAKQTAGWLYVSGSGLNTTTLQSIENSYRLTSNMTRVTDPVIDAAYGRLGTELDPGKANAIARELMTQLIAKKVAIPIFIGNEPYAVGKKVGTWSPPPGLAETPGSFETMTPN